MPVLVICEFTTLSFSVVFLYLNSASFHSFVARKQYMNLHVAKKIRDYNLIQRLNRKSCTKHGS